MDSKKENDPQSSRDPNEDMSTISVRSGYSVATLNPEVAQYLEKRESSQYRVYPGAELDEYDFTHERIGLHKTNIIESISHMIKGTMGSSVLIMHEAFMYGGIWASLCTTFLCGFINAYAMYMLAKSAQLMYGRLRVSHLSYPDLAEVAAATGCWKRFRRCSKVFRHVVDLCLVLSLSSNCCIYQIMIAKTLTQVIEGIDISDWLSGNVRLYILVSAPLVMTLCVIRSLKFLAPFSMLADFFTAMCVLATLYYSLQTKQKLSELPAWKNVHGFVQFCGVCIYCTCGIAVCLPVENNMRRPRYFRLVVQWAMGTVSILTALTGFFGYWGWGEDCRSPVTVHMPRNTLTTILQCLLTVMLIVTFVVQFWVPFRILWHYIAKRYQRSSYRTLVLMERILRILFVCLVTIVSLLFPDLIQIMSFMGPFLVGIIGFIFPAIIESLITWKDDRELKIRWRRTKNFFLMIFGLLLSASAFY
ncbi:proton-coupled amino acid transporter-like protein pathetic [Anticarsia gemmatalis]|uniref:proton-coupled amino acid transporter-like protein pathetic n=1 Tax=Anticarsia gemmatalis TaxID=129554 RepID=UPI003F771F7E